MNRITISLVAAVARNGVIGEGGGMPWRLSSDMRRFKALTMGKPVIMGRRTYESIGKPLSGRTNIVVSRRQDFRPGGVTVVPSLDAAVSVAEAEARRAGVSEAMVIGGGEIYAAAIDRADRLYITHVEATPEGDVRFPAIDPALWTPVATEPVPAGGKDAAATTFVVYERRRGQAAG